MPNPIKNKIPQIRTGHHVPVAPETPNHGRDTKDSRNKGANGFHREKRIRLLESTRAGTSTGKTHESLASMRARCGRLFYAPELLATKRVARAHTGGT